MNCLIIDDDEMSRKVLKHFIEKTPPLILRQDCRNALDGLDAVKSERNIDLIFLDVQMPDMSGLEFIRTLNNSNIGIILTTSKPDHAVEAFELNVLDYLLKPIEYPRFIKAVHKATDLISKIRMDVEHYGNGLFIKNEGKLVKLKYSDIIYVEAMADYVMLHTHNAKKFIIHSTMKGIERKLLSSKQFVRLHRSFIANAEHIDYMQEMTAVVQEKVLPIGRLYKSEVYRRLNVL